MCKEMKTRSFIRKKAPTFLRWDVRCSLMMASDFPSHHDLRSSSVGSRHATFRCCAAPLHLGNRHFPVDSGPSIVVHAPALGAARGWLQRRSVVGLPTVTRDLLVVPCAVGRVCVCVLLGTGHLEV